MGAAVAWTLLQGPVYQAECILQYEREPVAVATDGRGVEQLNQEWYRTQDYLLTSRAVLERVVERLSLDKDREFTHGSAKGKSAANDRAIAVLSERVSVKPIANTRLVAVRVEDRNSSRASKIANAVAESYVEKSLEDRLAATKNALAWLSGEMRQATDRLVRTETEMHSRVNDASSALPFDEQRALVSAEIRRLSEALNDARLRRIELSARLNKLRSALRPDPFDIHTAELDQKPDIIALRADYSAARVKMHALQAAAGSEENHEVQVLEVRLTALREQMKLAVDGEFASAEANLVEAQAVESQILAMMERASKTARDLQKQQLNFSRLERERVEAEVLLKALRERSANAALARATGEAGAKVMQMAVARLQPISSEALRNAGLGAVVGALLAIVLQRTSLVRRIS